MSVYWLAEALVKLVVWGSVAVLLGVAVVAIAGVWIARRHRKSRQL